MIDVTGGLNLKSRVALTVAGIVTVVIAAPFVICAAIWAVFGAVAAPAFTMMEVGPIRGAAIGAWVGV